MPTTDRGYPYETPADQPGHSLTGGQDGSAPILAQVIDADVAVIDTRVGATENGVVNLETRMDTAESGITSLDGRVTENENDIAALDGRVTTNEGNISAAAADITALTGRVTTNESNIDTTENNLATHEAATTTVHGIADTSQLITEGDPRLTDAREPTAHAATHAEAGADPVTPAAIGALPVAGGTITGDLTVAGNTTVGGKNDAEPMQLCGRLTTTGAPSTGTWATGDAIIDDLGVWHLCTAGGTPGTWT